MNPVSNKILVNAAVVVALVLLSILATPQTYLLSAYKVPVGQIQFTETAQTYLMDDYVNPDLASPHSQQLLNSQGLNPRRYNFNFPEDTPTIGPKSLYIPSTSSNVMSLINGIPFERSEDIHLFAPGLGQGWYAHDIPRLLLTPSNNRVDLHYPADTHRSGLRTVYIAPVKLANKVAVQHRKWITSLPRIGILLSVVSAFICIFGLLFGKHRSAFALLGALSVLSFLQFLLSFLDVKIYPAFVTHFLKLGIPGGTLILLLMWSRTPKRTESLTAPITPALTVYAGLGPVFGLIIMLLPYPMPSPLLGTTWVLTSTLPLVILWPVINLLQDLNERRSILEALQSKISEQGLMLDEKAA